MSLKKSTYEASIFSKATMIAYSEMSVGTTPLNPKFKRPKIGCIYISKVDINRDSSFFCYLILFFIHQL